LDGVSIEVKKMKAIYPRQTTLSLPTLSVRAIKLVLALITGVSGVGGYCAGFISSAAPAAERQEEILDDEVSNLADVLVKYLFDLTIPAEGFSCPGQPIQFGAPAAQKGIDGKQVIEDLERDWLWRPSATRIRKGN